MVSKRKLNKINYKIMEGLQHWWDFPNRLLSTVTNDTFIPDSNIHSNKKRTYISKEHVLGAYNVWNSPGIGPNMQENKNSRGNQRNIVSLQPIVSMKYCNFIKCISMNILSFYFIFLTFYCKLNYKQSVPFFIGQPAYQGHGC